MHRYILELRRRRSQQLQSTVASVRKIPQGPSLQGLARRWKAVLEQLGKEACPAGKILAPVFTSDLDAVRQLQARMGRTT